jgi:hypothetical protein
MALLVLTSHEAQCKLLTDSNSTATATTATVIADFTAVITVHTTGRYL